MLQFSRIQTLLLATGLILGLCSCGGGKSLRPDDSGEAPADPQVAGLPALGKLPAPSRDISELAADGFLELDPISPNATSNAIDGGGFLILDNSSLNVMTYALYGVSGFDGDNYPMSVKLDVEGSGSDFYVAFSDYAAGKWALSGPFNADGEFGIPILDEHTSTTAFTSPAHTNYFALIVPNGSSVELHGLSLGVSGGKNAPKPVAFAQGEGSANGFYLHWFESESFNEPDFAGYILERAPAFSGVFTPLASAPSREAAFKDLTALESEQYRYRVATYDLSGNSAVGGINIDGPQAGEEAMPVLVLKMPRGPFPGPTDIAVDISDSYDPEGEGITVFNIAVYNPLPVIMSGPSTTLHLQPGCHPVFCSVQCADGRYCFVQGYIKILPQWDAQSEVLRASEPTNGSQAARLKRFRGGLQPSDGLATLCGYDTTARALTFWHQDGSGMRPYRDPYFEDAVYVGEPVVDGDALLFPLANYGYYGVAGFDGSNVFVDSLYIHEGYTDIALVRDNSGRLWYIHGGNDGAEKLLCKEYRGTEMEFDLAAPASAVNYLDALLEPTSGHIFAFYNDGTALYYVEWDPETQTGVDGGPVGIGNFAKVLDAEINPENGRIGVICYSGVYIKYVEQDSLGGWTAPVKIDDSDSNASEADLAPSAEGKLNAFFPLNSGQAHRYILSSGSWSMQNTASYSSDSGNDPVLIQVPGSPDMRVADKCGDGVIRLARLKQNGTDQVFASIDSSIGQGFDMHAAAGADGLHLICANVHDPSKVTHMLSPIGPDEGSVWTEENGFTATAGLNLEATSEGAVYATGFDDPDASLYYWDSGAGNFTSEYSVGAQAEYRPMLGPGTLEDKVSFAVWDPVGSQLQQAICKHGDVPNTSTLPLTTSPVWEGVCFQADNYKGYFSASGISQDEPKLALTTQNFAVSEILAEVSFGGEISPYDKPCLRGRLVDYSPYWTPSYFQAGLALDMLAANGDLFSPQRFKKLQAGPTLSEQLPLGSVSTLSWLRRSVSCGQMNGVTAVDLVASVDGTETYFGWSNFGNWESLELPGGLDGMTQPLIVCGNDGRWHIIYKNWKTDEIMIRSTV